MIMVKAGPVNGPAFAFVANEKIPKFTGTGFQRGPPSSVYAGEAGGLEILRFKIKTYEKNCVRFYNGDGLILCRQSSK
jgi:hypothetical protein